MNNLISIIIPHYNRFLLLEAAINSLLEQTNKNWELIIVDDGSLDESVYVLKQHLNTDQRIKFSQRKAGSKGANRCRNIGAEQANGQYLVFLDSDDLVGNTFIETRLKYIQQYPELDFIVFPEAFFDKAPVHGFQPIRSNHTQETDLERFFRVQLPWMISGPLWKKSSFIKLGGFDERLQSNQEWDLHIRALLHNLEYVKLENEIPEVFIRRSIEVKGITNTATLRKRFENKNMALDNILEIHRKNGFLNQRNTSNKAFFNLYLNYCVLMAMEEEFDSAHKLWRRFYTEKIITFGEWWYWKNYLHPIVLRNKPLKKLMEFISCRLAPKSYFFIQ